MMSTMGEIMISKTSSIDTVRDSTARESSFTIETILLQLTAQKR